MDLGQTGFSQVMAFLPIYKFHKCVSWHRGNDSARNVLQILGIKFWEKMI